MKWENPDSAHQQMVEDTRVLVENENFDQIVEGPTRFWEGQCQSLIDHCWVNIPDKVLECKNISRAAGDHNLVKVKYRLKGNDGRSNLVIKRMRRQFDPEDYRRRIAQIDWEPMYLMTDVDLANFYFEEKLLSVLNEMAPIVKFQPRKKVNN